LNDYVNYKPSQLQETREEIGLKKEQMEVEIAVNKAVKETIERLKSESVVNTHDYCR
jgi:chaperonin cofactor prefoldin